MNKKRAYSKRIIITIMVVAMLHLSVQRSKAPELVPTVAVLVVVGIVIGVGIAVISKLREIENRQKCEECGRTVEDKDGNVPDICPNPACEEPIPHPETAYIQVDNPQDHPCWPYIGAPGCCYPPWTEFNQPCEGGAAATSSESEGVPIGWEGPDPYPYPYFWPLAQPHAPYDTSKSTYTTELQWSTNGAVTWQTYTLPDGRNFDPHVFYNLEIEVRVFSSVEEMGAEAETGTPIDVPVMIAPAHQAVLLRMAEVDATQ